MKASQTQVFLFDGERKAVQSRVNEFLRTLGREGSLEPNIAGIGYNFQGDEWDGRTRIDGSASHGIMLVAYYPTISETIRSDPVSDQPGSFGEGDTAVSVEEILRAINEERPASNLFARLFKHLMRR